VAQLQHSKKEEPVTGICPQNLFGPKIATGSQPCFLSTHVARQVHWPHPGRKFEFLYRILLHTHQERADAHKKETW
jgi:hypothetical protein